MTDKAKQKAEELVEKFGNEKLALKCVDELLDLEQKTRRPYLSTGGAVDIGAYQFFHRVKQHLEHYNEWQSNNT